MLTDKTKQPPDKGQKGSVIIMTYVYAYKRVNETEWHIAETNINCMNERDFLLYIFDPCSGFGVLDKVRILEIIK